MSYRLGVDLGTTWSAAAVFDGNQPTMVGLGNRALQIPSVVFIPSEGEPLVGEAAERRAVAEPARVAREFKRRFADPVPLLVAGVPFTPQQLTAHLLRWVIGRATERMGGAPDELTLTYPANWGSYRRSLLDEVCDLAGTAAALPVTYCTEPEAAAAQYVFRTESTADGSLLVYDLGGGTFDVCVLTAENGAYSIAGQPAGLDNLGGIDFDEMILHRVVRQCAPAGFDSTDPTTITALNRIRRECTDAKEALSSDVDVTIPVMMPGVDTTYRLLRHELEEMIQPAIQQTVVGTKEAIAASGIDPSQLWAIVLVGGSSRIPLVSELLFRELGVPVALNTHPKHDVALGAALTGRCIPSPRHRTPPLARPPAPAKLASQPAAPLPTALHPVLPAELNEPSQLDPVARRTSRLNRRTLRWLVVAALLVGVSGTVIVVNSLDHNRPDTNRAIPRPATSAPPSSPSSQALPRAAAPLGDDTIVWPRVRNGAWGIGTITLTGRIETLAEDPALDSSFPVLSPDRRSVIYLRENTEQWSLRVAAADGSSDQTLLTSLEGCRRVQAPAWGPDNLLALPCQKSSGAGTALELVTLDGKILRILDRGFLGDPTFSRDGRFIVYWRNDYGDGDGGALYAISTDGSNRRQLTRGSDALDNDPVISPDGRSVAYRTKRKGRLVIASINLSYPNPQDDLATPEILSRGDVDEQEPSWSPDGKRIAYVRGLGDAREIYIMNADGTGRRPLLDDDQPDAAPAWSAR